MVLSRVDAPAPGRRDATARGLSAPRRALVALMQRIRFGRIHRLAVRGGEPVLDESVRWTRTVKPCGANGPHPSMRLADFALSKEVACFFDELGRLGDAELLEVQVRD